MIEVLADSQSNRLGIRLSGALSAEEREHTFVPKVEEILDSHGSIRLLVELADDFAGGEFDGTFLGRRIDRFEKVAVVGNPDRLVPLKIVSRQLKGDLRVFERDQGQEAWRWLAQ